MSSEADAHGQAGYVRRSSMVFVIVVISSLLVRLGVYLLDNFSYDDAYITLRFAENLVRYGSFTYNPGQIVYGASSPLYTILLGLLTTIVPGAMMPGVMQWLGVIFLYGTAWLVYRHVPISSVLRLVLVIALLSYPRFFFASLGGMEECLIMLLMVSSWLAFIEHRHAVAGILLGLLFVSKIDSVLWIASVMAPMILIWRRGLVRTLTAATATALPWIIYSLVSFSSLIPHTVAAKRAAYPLANILAIWEILKLSTPEGFINSPLAIVLFGVGANGLLLLSIAVAIRRSSWWVLPFPIYCFAYTAVLVVSGTWSGLWDRWTVPMWMCLIFSAAYLANVALIKRFRGGIERITFRTAILLVALTIPALAVPIAYGHRSNLDIKPYETVGSWLHDHASPGDRLMLEPIGIIGYRSQLYIHDFIGLVSPDVTYARESSGRADAWYAEYLRRKRPEYIILRAAEFQSNRFLFGGYGGRIFDDCAKLWFDSAYAYVHEWENANPAFDLVLFRRSDVTPHRP